MVYGRNDAPAWEQVNLKSVRLSYKSNPVSEPTLTPEQCRAGRGLLGWTQRDLALAAEVAIKTVTDFERGRRQPYPRTLADMRRALEDAGLTFLAENGGGEGVRFAGPGPKRARPKS